MWGVFTMQEGSRKLEALDTNGRGVCTPPLLVGNFRCPAVIVHQRWAASSKFVAGGVRLVAVEWCSDVLVISAHLPHIKKGNAEFTELLA